MLWVGYLQCTSECLKVFDQTHFLKTDQMTKQNLLESLLDQAENLSALTRTYNFTQTETPVCYSVRAQVYWHVFDVVNIYLGQT